MHRIVIMEHAMIEHHQLHQSLKRQRVGMRVLDIDEEDHEESLQRFILPYSLPCRLPGRLFDTLMMSHYHYHYRDHPNNHQKIYTHRHLNNLVEEPQFNWKESRIKISYVSVRASIDLFVFVFLQLHSTFSHF